MKTGIVSSACFGTENYEKGLERAREHGYSCYDYQGIAAPASAFYAMSEKECVTYFERLRRASENAGMSCSQMHAVWPADDTTEEARRYSFEHYYKRGIIAASALGCDALVVHPLMPLGMGNEPEEARAGIREINLRFWSELLPFAKSAGVRVCLENMPFTDHGLASTPSIKALVDEIGDPYFKVCLDTGHANVFAEDLYDDLALLGSDLAVLHVHDNNGQSDNHLHPFSGTANWENFRRGLKHIDPDVVVSLETSVKAKYPAHLREEAERLLAKVAEYLADREDVL